VAVGPHGETVHALLHIGFHSGTVPRLFARLREAEREAARTNVWRDARTYRQALRGVEESVTRFLTRDLAAVLNSSPAWGGRELTVSKIHLGTNRIRLELELHGETSTAEMEWEDLSGWLAAGWVEAGFLATLPPEPARVFEHALAYLYKRAGIDLVREQIQATLPKDAKHFEIGPAGMLVWYGSREAKPLLYDLADPSPDMRPRNHIDLHPAPGPILDAVQLIFRRAPLTWLQWTEVWQAKPDAKLNSLFGKPDWERTLLPSLATPAAIEAESASAAS
jgi:hypothetical protein